MAYRTSIQFIFILYVGLDLGLGKYYMIYCIMEKYMVLFITNAL